MTGTEMAVMTAAEMAEAMVLAVKVSVETVAAKATEAGMVAARTRATKMETELTA